MDGQEMSFRAGELIHVDPDETEVAPGQYVVAHVPSSNQVVFRQVQYDGTRPYLRALNPHWPPIHDEFHILGRVVGRSQIL